MTTQAVGSGVVFPPAGEGSFDFIKVLKHFFSPQPTADTVIATAPPAKQIIATVEPFTAEVNDLLSGITGFIYSHLAGTTQFEVFVEAIRPDGTAIALGSLSIFPGALDVNTEKYEAVIWGSPPIIDVAGNWLGIRISANRTGTNVAMRPQNSNMLLAGG